VTPKRRPRKVTLAPVEIPTPTRQWDRMSELLYLCVLTGCIPDARPVSLILISGPGTGKTELIERFLPNGFLSYQSDLTWKGFMPLLRQAKRGRITHLVFTEFQKIFMRKQSTADNMIGTLIQAMEEGVGNISVHSLQEFGGARLGVLGAITHGTLAKKQTYLAEMGFLSRCFLIPWEPTPDEIREVMRRIRHGDDSDMEPLMIPESARNGAAAKLSVRNIPLPIGKLIEEFTWERYGTDSLRPVKRFRALAVASALRHGDTSVKDHHWAWVAQFTDYWDKVVID